MSVRLTAIAFVTCCCLCGTASAGVVADAYLNQLMLVEQDLVGLVRAMPAERYDFRPTGGAFATMI